VRIEVPKIDGHSAIAAISHEIIGLDTGNPIGYPESRQGPRTPSRYISLFGGNYVGRFASHSECVAFAGGVESVLNHMEPLHNRGSAQRLGPAAA